MSGHLTEILQNLMRNNKGRTNDYGKSVECTGDEDILRYKEPGIQNIADNTEIRIVLEIPGDSRKGDTIESEASPGEETLSPEAIPLINIERAPGWSGNGRSKAFYKHTTLPGNWRPLPGTNDRQLPVIPLPAHHKTRQPGEHQTGHVYQNRYPGFAAHPIAAIRHFTRALIGKATSFF